MHEPVEFDPSGPRAFERWLKLVHDADPGAVFPHLSLLRDENGRTSYEVLIAESLAATSRLERPAIVDLGCGDGMLLALYGARKPARLIGVEQSAKESELARETLRPFDAEVIEADIRATGLSGACADAVLSHMVLMLLEDAGGALAEAARLLKPDASFLAIVGSFGPPLGISGPVGRLVSQALAAEGKQVSSTDQRFRSEEAMRTLPWEANGFANAAIERIVFSRRLTIDQYWGFVAQMYPPRKLSIQGLRDLEAAVREEAALHATGGMVDVAMPLALLKAERAS